MSSWLDGCECAFLVPICVEEKYCFTPLICISLNSERLRALYFLATSALFRAGKHVLTHLHLLIYFKWSNLSHIYTLRAYFLSDVLYTNSP